MVYRGVCVCVCVWGGGGGGGGGIGQGRRESRRRVFRYIGCSGKGEECVECVR